VSAVRRDGNRPSRALRRCGIELLT
jgi:hypothetical protein